ncbi:MAG: beta-lactamase family protein [Bacteroidales bacterium]|nr:beta-lactamase family protein [Bacteroidales bacterium]
MKKIIFTAFLFFGIALGTLYSQNINKSKLDSLFNILAEKEKAMGSLTISKKGEVLYSRAIGFCALAGNERKPSTIHTKYRIGSITKMFTSVMIFQLIEEGKLNLTTTIDTYFPNLPNASAVTISNLLNHRSGWHNFTNDKEYLNWMTQPKTQEEMLAIFSQDKVDFEPDEKADYSNTNYVVLGYIIEKVDHQPYSKSLEERITSKVGLSSTYIGNKTNINHNESYSYQLLSQWIQAPETDMSIPGGAGSIVSTPTDLTSFIEALFSLKLISQSSLNQMKTIHDGYGMGMFQIPFYTKKALGHNGSIDAFASMLGYFPEDSIAISYCTNGQSYPLNDILIGVLSIVFNKEYNIPTFATNPGLTLSSTDLDKYLGVYSSAQLPLKISITKENTVLIAQATGQSSFPLEIFEKDKFKFDPAGIIMEFDPEINEMTLKQGGGVFLFTKEIQ